MKSTLCKLATATAAFGLLCGAAIAQQSQEVQVQATRAVNTKLVGRNTHGVPIVDLSLAYKVSLKDLDLSKSSGVKEAQRRVEAAANEACKEIGRQYPAGTPGESECTKAASAEAMVKVHQLVAAAEAAGGRG